MIDIKIGSVERQFRNVGEIDEAWINQQVKGLRRDGHPVCIFVTIKEGDVNISLATPDCNAAGGSRRLSQSEQRVLDTWIDEKLTTDNFTGGDVVGFFKKIKRYLR